MTYFKTNLVDGLSKINRDLTKNLKLLHIMISKKWGIDYGLLDILRFATMHFICLDVVGDSFI